MAEQRNDGVARVATNNRDSELAGVLLASDVSNECLSTDDIKGRNTEESLGIEAASLLQHFGGNWDGGVDRVGDDTDHGLGTVLGASNDEVLDDASIGLEEVVSCHAGFSWEVSSVSCSGELSVRIRPYEERQLE